LKDIQSFIKHAQFKAILTWQLLKKEGKKKQWSTKLHTQKT